MIKCLHTPACMTTEQHESRVLYREKLLGVQFQGIDAHEHRVIDRSRTRDMDAYQRQRKAGLQPAHIFGTAEVEAQAESRYEIEHETVMSRSVRKEFLPRLAESGVAVE